MLNIKSQDSKNLAKEHYLGVQYHLNQVLDYYVNFFDILIGNKKYQDAKSILYDSSELDPKTVNALGGKLCYGKKDKIAVSKIVNLFSDQKKYINTLFLNNQQGFLDFFTHLRLILKDLIVSEPKQLLELESNLIKKFPFIINSKSSFEEPLRKLLLLGVFNYNKFSDKTGFAVDKNKVENWERYDLCKALKVNTCAYCNRIYTFTILNDNGQGIISPSLDHFFDKSARPLFALSFYNLIPSCNNCNSTLKGEKKFSLDKYVHPYLSGFEDHASFNYVPLDTNAALGESLNLKVCIKPIKTSALKIQISNNIEMFKLNTVYTEHADYVQEIIKKKVISNNRYLDILRFETYKELNLSLEDAYRLAFGNYINEKDYYKRPLAKLTKDIAKQLGII